MKRFYIPHAYELDFTEGVFEGSVTGNGGTPLFQLHIVTNSGHNVTHKVGDTRVFPGVCGTGDQEPLGIIIECGFLALQSFLFRLILCHFSHLCN